MAQPARKEIRDYFSSSPSSRLQYGAAESTAFKYSLAQPHSCSFCKPIIWKVNDVTQQENAPRDDRSSSHPFWSRPVIPSVSLLELSAAVDASRAGCALYDWALDAVASAYTDKLKIQSPFTSVSLNLVFDSEANSSPLSRVQCRVVAKLTDGTGTVHELRSPGCFLQGRVDGEDPFADVIPSRPAAGDIFEPRSIRFAKACLGICMKHHQECVPDVSYGATRDAVNKRRPQVESEDLLNWQPGSIPRQDLPTRLLEIGTNTPTIVRLVDLRKASDATLNTVSSAGYAALSYCWGHGGNPVQLNAASINRLQQGFPSETLPATIRDVVRLSALIGIRYLWIDALCILQDSDADKQVELAKMAQYYHNNTVTISAASAASASEGLQLQGERPVHDYGPIQISTELGGKTGRLLLHSATLGIAEATTSRGWTLQESLLSQRIIICSNQLYYCCVTSNAECEGPHNQLSLRANRNFSQPESLVPHIFPASVWRMYPLMKQWTLGVQEFSRRNVAYASDKLPAISGFASMMHAKFQFQEEGKGYPYPAQYEGKVLFYLGGLFLSYDDQTVNANNLLWRATLNGTIRASSYRAPTWSWACLDGPIAEFTSHERLEGLAARLVRHQTGLVAPKNPYGEVTFASICVCAPVRLATDAAKFGDWLRATSGYGFYADTAKGQAEFEDALEHGSQDLFLLLVANNYNSRFFEGLVVSRRKLDAREEKSPPGGITWERTGFFKLTYRTQPQLSDVEARSEEKSKFFDVERATVNLV
ncbi:HET domain-containing protein [Microdochium nivale]|nr:HET domain-containing protein [Microdochium nivale]